MFVVTAAARNTAGVMRRENADVLMGGREIHARNVWLILAVNTAPVISSHGSVYVIFTGLASSVTMI